MTRFLTEAGVTASRRCWVMRRRTILERTTDDRSDRAILCTQSGRRLGLDFGMAAPRDE